MSKLLPYEAPTQAELDHVRGPQPGVKIVRDTVLWCSAVSGVHLTDQGVYNRRPIRGKSGPLTVKNASLHAVGRAWDPGVPSIAAGQVLAFRLLLGGPLIGVTEVIFNRTRWTSKGQEPYGGEDPHTTHVHVGFNRQWAANAIGDDYVRWTAWALGFSPS